jgi:hypothetical protein
MKREYASAALSIDGDRQRKEARLEWFEQTTTALLDVPLASSAVTTSQYEDLWREIEAVFAFARQRPGATRASIDGRLVVFSVVTRLVLDESRGDSALEDLGVDILKSFAGFEASALDYPESGDPIVKDWDFRKHLKALSQLSNHEPHSGLLSVSIHYFRCMDQLLAYDFWRSNHRNNGRVRIGPFTVSDGGYGEKLIERPAVILEGDDLRRFAKCAWQAMHPSACDPGEERLTSYLRHLKPSPDVAVIQD